MVLFLQSEFQFLIVYIATAKSRVSAENIGIKVSALSPSCPLFTAIVLPIL